MFVIDNNQQKKKTSFFIHFNIYMYERIIFILTFYGPENCFSSFIAKMKTSKETLSNYLVLSNNRYYNNNSQHNSFLSYENSFSIKQIDLLELLSTIINILFLTQFFHRVLKNLSLFWIRQISYKVFDIQRDFIILLLFVIYFFFL